MAICVRCCSISPERANGFGTVTFALVFGEVVVLPTGDGMLVLPSSSAAVDRPAFFRSGVNDNMRRTDDAPAAMAATAALRETGAAGAVAGDGRDGVVDGVPSLKLFDDVVVMPRPNSPGRETVAEEPPGVDDGL